MELISAESPMEDDFKSQLNSPTRSRFPMPVGNLSVGFPAYETYVCALRPSMVQVRYAFTTTARCLRNRNSQAQSQRTSRSQIALR